MVQGQRCLLSYSATGSGQDVTVDLQDSVTVDIFYSVYSMCMNVYAVLVMINYFRQESVQVLRSAACVRMYVSM